MALQAKMDSASVIKNKVGNDFFDWKNKITANIFTSAVGCMFAYTKPEQFFKSTRSSAI